MPTLLHLSTNITNMEIDIIIIFNTIISWSSYPHKVEYENKLLNIIIIFISIIQQWEKIAIALHSIDGSH